MHRVSGAATSSAKPSGELDAKRRHAHPRGCCSSARRLEPHITSSARLYSLAKFFGRTQLARSDCVTIAPATSTICGQPLAGASCKKRERLFLLPVIHRPPHTRRIYVHPHARRFPRTSRPRRRCKIGAAAHSADGLRSSRRQAFANPKHVDSNVPWHTVRKASSRRSAMATAAPSRR